MLFGVRRRSTTGRSGRRCVPPVNRSVSSHAEDGDSFTVSLRRVDHIDHAEFRGYVFALLFFKRS